MKIIEIKDSKNFCKKEHCKKSVIIGIMSQFLYELSPKSVKDGKTHIKQTYDSAHIFNIIISSLLNIIKKEINN